MGVGGRAVWSGVDSESAAFAVTAGREDADSGVGRRSRSSGADGASGSGAPRPATIYDVARVAGVSHQTVSRFLKGYQGIRPETRERVVEALRALDYRPNLAARSLTTGQSHRIGALTHELDQFGPGQVVQGATAEAREAGFLLDVITLDVSDAGAIERALAVVRQQDLAGVLALSSTDEMTRAFQEADFHVPVYIGTEEDDAFSAHPSELTRVGFPALIGHLTGLGHRAFLHIAGPGSHTAARNRVRAFESALAAHGLRPAGIVHGDWSARSGHAAIAGLPGDVNATAIVAGNDQMALGAMLALAERGLRVPEDVSVTGLDDIPDSAYFTPPLTTLRVDFAAQGRHAVRQLLGRVKGVSGPETPALPSQLVVRRSTAPARDR